MIARGRRPLAPVVALAVLMSGGASAAAAPAPQPPPKVILVRPPAAPAAVTEALVRLRGELVAAGFDAQVVEQVLGLDVRASLEKLSPASDGAATALVAVVASAEPGSAELWVIDRVTGKTVVRRVNAGATDPPRMAEVLSVRAVELAAGELPRAGDWPAARQQRAAERARGRALGHRDAGGGRLDLGGGGGRRHRLRRRRSLERDPLGRAARAGARAAFLRAGQLRGPRDLSARRHAEQGYAGLSQTILLAEVIARFRRGRRIEPLLSLGAGALRLAADSHEAAPFGAVSGARWGAAGDVGVGLRIPLRRHRFELGVEAHVLFAQPYPTVQFLGNEVAQAGRPSLIGSVTLLGGI